jgi:hypothetical protein
LVQWRKRQKKKDVMMQGADANESDSVTPSSALTKSDTRMVPVNYEIADSLLSHKADLDALRQRVEQTFDWYTEEPPTSVAPYFPFIQSSGMGKTKLCMR